MVITLLTVVTISIMYRKNQEIKELESIVNKLSTENFILQTEVGRYEIGLEIFKERNSSGAKQFDEILSQETE